MPSISGRILNTYTYVWIKNFTAHTQRIFTSKTQATAVQYYSINRKNSCFESRFFLRFFAKNVQNKYIRLLGSIVRTTDPYCIHIREIQKIHQGQFICVCVPLR